MGEVIDADIEAREVATVTNDEDVKFPATVINPIMSSRLLGKITAGHGLNHCTTLTGFRWTDGVDGLAFDYEEAVGYCSDSVVVRDKDGVPAAVRIADVVVRLKDQGLGT